MDEMRGSDMLNDSRISIDVATMLVLTLMENGMDACQVFSMPLIEEIYESCREFPSE